MKLVFSKSLFVRHNEKICANRNTLKFELFNPVVYYEKFCVKFPCRSRCPSCCDLNQPALSLSSIADAMNVMKHSQELRLLFSPSGPVPLTLVSMVITA